jgi:hypothetical protein
MNLVRSASRISSLILLAFGGRSVIAAGAGPTHEHSTFGIVGYDPEDP